jgi:hypothetical protein
MFKTCIRYLSLDRSLHPSPSIIKDRRKHVRFYLINSLEIRCRRTVAGKKLVLMVKDCIRYLFLDRNLNPELAY